MIRNPLFFQLNRSFDFGKWIRINVRLLLHIHLHSKRENS